MDKLDKDIMKARKTYTPTKHFTKNTMKKIHASKRKHQAFTWLKPFALTGTVFASAILVFSFISIQDSNKLNSTSQKPQSPVSTAKSNAPETASQFTNDIAALDKEVASYTISYNEAALEDINQ